MEYGEEVVDRIKTAVFDIDGTLSEKVEGGRGIHDYDRVGEDILHKDIAELLYMFYSVGYRIVIVTGRPDKCKHETKTWLAKHNLPYDDLFMRKTGDFRSDAVVKPEIYHNFIEDKYDVKFWVDDRKRVVDAMRYLGIRVLQVAPGEF